MNRYIIKSFKGGYSPYTDTGFAGAFGEGTRNLDIRRSRDSLYCQQALMDDLAPGSMTTLAKFILPASDGNTYIATSDRIFKRDSNRVYTTAYVSPFDGISGLEEWYNNVGDTFIYWTTTIKLNRKRILHNTTPINPNWSDVNATVNGKSYPKGLNDSFSHYMKKINGALLGANDSRLFFVGYDDSYTDNALDLIPGNQVKILLERGRDAIMACKRKDARQLAGMFKWDGLSLAWNDKAEYSIAEINSMIDTPIPMMQIGTDGRVIRSDLESADEEISNPLFKFFGGGQTYPDGVDVDDGLALFGAWGNGVGNSGIYSYGRKIHGADLVPNLEYQFDCDEIGSVKKVNEDILFTYRKGTDFGVKRVDTANKAIGIYRSFAFIAPADFDKEPEWMAIKLTTTPMPAGCSISVKRRINRDGDFTSANLEGGTTTFDITNGTEAIFLIGDAGKVCEFEVTLNPSGNISPEVTQIELFFQ